MNWLRLLFEVAAEALTAWRSRKSEPAEPTASQRDIAIGVASAETARQEGKRAPKLTREVIQRRGKTDEDTWPGERK